jgi:hypothetical protein
VADYRPRETADHRKKDDTASIELIKTLIFCRSRGLCKIVRFWSDLLPKPDQSTSMLPKSWPKESDMIVANDVSQ